MTPAIRAAEAAQTEFTLHHYAHDPQADSFGQEAAEKLGASPDRVFKTLVARVVAERTLSYVVGTISPLGGRKKLPAFLDESALSQATILVSAGQRGIQMELSPTDLVRLTAATPAALTAR